MDLETAAGKGFELVRLKGGEQSVRCLTHGETMHVGTGPGEEALTLHVRQQRIVERVRERSGQGHGPLVIWDVESQVLRY
jgi:hypothetical protein